MIIMDEKGEDMPDKPERKQVDVKKAVAERTSLKEEIKKINEERAEK